MQDTLLHRQSPSTLSTIEKKLSKRLQQNLYCIDNGQLIINEDSLNILSMIPSNSIDLILTDPPYNIEYAHWDIFTTATIKKITRQWHRILKPNGSIFCFAAWSYVCEVIKAFNKNLHLNDWIIYDRIKGRGTKKRLVSTREDLLWYVKSENWFFDKEKAYSMIPKKTKGMGTKNGKATRALSNVWTDISPIVPWASEKLAVGFPQKPIAIADRIINVFSEQGSLILDCYAGTGTFAASAKKNNCYSISIEKDKGRYELTCDRVKGQKNAAFGI